MNKSASNRGEQTHHQPARSNRYQYQYRYHNRPNSSSSSSNRLVNIKKVKQLQSDNKHDSSIDKYRRCNKQCQPITTSKTMFKGRSTSHRYRATKVAVAMLASMLIVTCAHLTLGYPSGAPEQACKDLRPNHGSEPSSDSSPYELTQDKQTSNAGDQIKVTLSSPSQTTFKGLIVQALNSKDEPVGKFLAGKGLKTLDSCSAVTHSDREPKKTATLVWEAPSDLKTAETIHFKATVVHKIDQFYMNIISKVVS